MRERERERERERCNTQMYEIKIISMTNLTTILLNTFLFYVNFNKFTIKLYFLLIFFMLAKISKKSKIKNYVINQKSRIMSLIKGLNFKNMQFKLFNS